MPSEGRRACPDARPLTRVPHPRQRGSDNSSSARFLSDTVLIGPDRAIPAPAPAALCPRRNLRRGVVAVLAFVATSCLYLLFVTPGLESCRRAAGHDFLAFYAAGTLAREGRPTELYELGVVSAVEKGVARSAGIDLDGSVGPWWNPPVYAWVFAPLSALSFGKALLIWTGVNLAAAAIAVWLLGRSMPLRSDRVLIALLVLASAPLLQSITHGQNSAISLLLVSIAAIAWRGGQTFTASVCLGLLLYKPQLAAVLAVVLVLHRGWRAGAGLVYVGFVILLLTNATMPAALSDYLYRLPQNLHVVQVEQTYLWERHVTLNAFWRLLLQGRGPGETTGWVHAMTIVTAAPLLLGLAFAARRPHSTGALIAATIVTAPLLMPFYFDYDLLLLAVAGAMTTTVNRKTFALWVALYVWLYVNPYVAGAMRLNLTVPLLWGLAASLIAGAIRTEQAQSRDEVIELLTTRARAA